MIAILDILIFFSFFTLLAGLNFRMVQQVKNIPITEANILILIFLFGLDLVFVAMTARFFELGVDLNWAVILMTCFGLLSLSSITIGVMVKMGLATGKKMRTLLRLPLIGALVGFYLKDERALYLFVGIELILTIYFFMMKDEYNYVFRQQIKGLYGFLLFAILLKNNFLAYSLIGLFIFVLMKNQIINQVKLKLVLEKSQNEI